MPLAKRIVLKWNPNTDSKMAQDYKWYCPYCNKVYDRQTDAQLCCMESKAKPYWFKEGMTPTHEPVGVRHEGEFVPLEAGSRVDTDRDIRYNTATGDVVAFGERTHTIIPKKEQRDYVSSTVSTFCYIDRVFEEWWGTLKDDYNDGGATFERRHSVRWNSLIKWIDRYLELKVIPDHQVRCLIETRQQYKDFMAEDILYTLKTLGEKADHMYCAERDYFPGPLKKYYDYAMRHLVCDVATFSQDYEHFTDLVTRLEELL